ncbi:alpha-ribazole phosphatase [Methylomonas sp. AM2-LC]|uniref:alpha-ribazole phosphatase n=1 Tax=Methylomonas sp. AM2-LC TaxID=3153301 RepID=UPI003263F339
MEIYLVRHTTPAISPGICYGQTDIELADSFSEEFARLQNKLKHLEKPLVYSSPLKRCLHLAENMTQALNFDTVTQDARLQELNFGSWEMLAWPQIPKAELDAWTKNLTGYAPPQGESVQDLHARAQHFLADLCAANNMQSCILFTHAGVIRSLLAQILYEDLQQALKIQIAYASVTKLIVNGQDVQVEYQNQ